MMMIFVRFYEKKEIKARRISRGLLYLLMFRSSNFSFLVTFGDKVTKIRKYYVIFVYILQGKMGKMEKNGKKITQLK